MEALDWARWQFGITTVYHFIFVPLTIGLSTLVAIMQTLAYRQRRRHPEIADSWMRLTNFFGNLLVINFALGAATGLVQEFQFGMNWSEYSRYVGDVFGAPLALEGLLAFFLESTFLGLWIFGRERMSKGLHLLTIWMVALGTTTSAYFILAANSFMQHPVAAVFNPETGRAELDPDAGGFIGLLTNVTTLVAFPHVLAGAWLTAAAFVTGVATWHMYHHSSKAAKLAGAAPATVAAGAAGQIPGQAPGQEPGHGATGPDPAGLEEQADTAAAAGTTATDPAPGAREVEMSAADHEHLARDVYRPGVRLGLISLLVAGVMVIATGDFQAKIMFEQQPMKMAAAEGLCHTETGAGFSILTIGSVDAFNSNCDDLVRVLEVPYALSILAEYDPNATLQGVEELQEQYEEQFGETVTLRDGTVREMNYAPNLFTTYWAFRLMIGLAVFSAIVAVAGMWYTRRGAFTVPRWFSVFALLTIPAPFLANSAGWVFTEIGRQPWVVHPAPDGPIDVRLLTLDGVSHAPAWQVIVSLTVFTLLYGVLAFFWYRLISRSAAKGVSVKPPAREAEGADQPLTFGS